MNRPCVYAGGVLAALAVGAWMTVGGPAIAQGTMGQGTTEQGTRATYTPTRVLFTPYRVNQGTHTWCTVLLDGRVAADTWVRIEQEKEGDETTEDIAALPYYTKIAKGTDRTSFILQLGPASLARSVRVVAVNPDMPDHRATGDLEVMVWPQGW